MKKRFMNFIPIFLLLCGLLLTSCGSAAPVSYDAGQYQLRRLTLDGTELDLSLVYPEGACLLLESSGNGVLFLGKEFCDVQWQQAGESFILTVNELTASGTAANGTLTLSFDSLGLTYFFAEGQAELPAAAEAAPAELTPLQQRWNGSWSGRLWFEDPQGEWADYEYRSMAVDAAVTLTAEGKGSIRLSNSFYSALLPMAEISISADGAAAKCNSGYFMAYPCEEWGVDIALSEELPSQIEDTVIMHPDVWEFGHYYVSGEEEQPQEEQSVDVLRLHGKCRDSAGSFAYKIVLTR